ncbi:hypothetical protein [Lysinibacillus varians]|uniref:Molecular chaperone DnaJ n=1 Tax=Lysinibacillus varians TaxID=1145276 RepID=A0ABY2T456_9BACI|nr:hypothetical protein [Lysinibacillus varians]AHN22023.1 hypothetical protein T479_12040 [Lysinibacillus varians]TKI51194.1 hypothetical protein FC752_22345 [Lysinibacillus varians]
MFCVIQKIQKKRQDEYGAAKELLVDTNVYTVGGEEITEYTYHYSEERFERPILDAYKISIHHSYREDGKVKKKQWAICTMSYYDVVECSVEDKIINSEIEVKVSEMGISKGKLYKMIYDKLIPIEEAIRAEYEQTDEYKVHQEHMAILSTHRNIKNEFEKIYGSGTYNRIYDVFGNVRNKEYLEQLIAYKGTADDARKAQEEYRKRSEQEQQKRFEDYFKNGGSSYYTTSQSNYTDDEKKVLHEIYRMASKKFHPDVSGDDGSKMKLLTKLKEQWGL